MRRTPRYEKHGTPAASRCCAMSCASSPRTRRTRTPANPTTPPITRLWNRWSSSSPGWKRPPLLAAFFVSARTHQPHHPAHMRAEGHHGGMGIAFEQGFVDLPVVLQVTIPGIARHDIAQQQRVEADFRAAVEEVQEFIAGQRVQLHVVLVERPDEGQGVAGLPGAFDMRESLDQYRALVAVLQTRRRQANAQYQDGFGKFEEFHQAVQAELANACAAVGQQLHYAIARELLQRLADGRAADIELLREVCGHQPLPLHETAAHDAFENAVDRFFDERTLGLIFIQGHAFLPAAHKDELAILAYRDLPGSENPATVWHCR